MAKKIKKLRRRNRILKNRSKTLKNIVKRLKDSHYQTPIINWLGIARTFRIYNG